jgi:hypothetical protein
MFLWSKARPTRKADNGHNSNRNEYQKHKNFHGGVERGRVLDL